MIYIRSFSKTLFPSLRLAALVADKIVKYRGRDMALADLMLLMKGYLTVNTLSINQAILGGILIKNNFSLKQVNRDKIVNLKLKKELMLDCLDKYCSIYSPEGIKQIKWKIPDGGFFLKISVPFVVDDNEVLNYAVNFRVIFTPMSFFYFKEGGPETGNPESCSYFIKKNNIKLVITSASQPSSYKIVSFVDLHGNGIKRIAVKVDDVSKTFNRAIKQGAVPLNYPTKNQDDKGFLTVASIKIFDDNEIIFVNYDNYNGDFMPGYKNISEDWLRPPQDTLLEKIDHLACALRLNEISLWEKYINNVFRSKTVKKIDERQTSKNKKIGILLKVLQSENKSVNNVLVESDNKNRSQIQLFIDENFGSGIQHVAFSTSNIFRTVELLKLNGVKFTKYPDSYFVQLEKKHPALDIESLKKHGVLCDVVDGALLFQVFTAPLGDRATFFYEIVQRVNNYEGFGLDNIHALFEAMEYELNIN